MIRWELSPNARRYEWAVAVLAEKRRMRHKVPPSITRIVESKPALFPWLQFDLDAFWHMCRMRPVHFGGVGYIPDSAIADYLRLFQIEMGREDREDFIRNIQVLDEEYLKVQSEQRKAEEDADKDKNKKPEARPQRPRRPQRQGS